MFFDNPFVTQLLVEERREYAMRQAEQARLIRAVKGSGKSRRWRLPMILALKNLLALFMRPQSIRLAETTPICEE